MTPTPHRPGWFLLTRHWLSLLGAALVTTAGISWLFVLPLHVRGHVPNPYIGIIVFLILPAVFFGGLGLIVIGVFLGRRRIRKGFAEVTFDRRAALRRLVWFVAITTALNIVIGTQLTYRAINYMETPQFCGAACHSMRPEWTAYQNSPHSGVQCVECHVAPGAAGWISSKMNGIHQLVATVLNKYERPIPSPVETNRLVPARETCERCHWPQMSVGPRLRVFSKFSNDEGNTRSETVLLMMVGGDEKSIHGAHFGKGVHIRFAADAARQTILSIEYRNSSGEVQTFASADPPSDRGKTPAKYDMQCVDCHNRPAHAFELPSRAVDRALVSGDIPVTLPFIKKEAVDLLQAYYRTREEAKETLPQALAGFYRLHYPELYEERAPAVLQSSNALLAIYYRNVFPEMNITWGTYPNNLGHSDSPGCFRCHDGAHANAKGETITQDCNTCHKLLAVEETSPEILKTFGMSDAIAGPQSNNGR